jgi:hypothetical protein
VGKIFLSGFFTFCKTGADLIPARSNPWKGFRQPLTSGQKPGGDGPGRGVRKASNTATPSSGRRWWSLGMDNEPSGHAVAVVLSSLLKVMAFAFFASKERRIMSNRSFLALVFSLMLLLALLLGPPLGVAQGKTPPTEEEAKRAKALMEEKADRSAEQSLQGSKPQEMKLRGRNKPGDCPAMDDKEPQEGGKKLNPAD